METFDNLDFSLTYGNFDPAEVQVDETINAVFVVDISPSVSSYISELNYAFADFVQSMQDSHQVDQLMVSVVEFNDTVRVRSGFQPIAQLPAMHFTPSGGGTALYDAVLKGLENALAYRHNLARSGVNTKTLLFVITDGEDNSSHQKASKVKQEIDLLMADEQNVFSFASVLFGVGEAANFQKAQKDMGIELLAKVGTSGDEIRRMIGLVSQSISRTSRNQAVQF